MAEKKEVKEKFIEKIIKFDIEPFNYDLIVIVSESVTKSREMRNEHLGYYEPDDHHAAMHCSLGHTSFIFLTYGADIGSIAHEVFHFVWKLMSWIGAEHNNEVMAYHVGHYTRECAKFVFQHTTEENMPKDVMAVNPTKPKVKTKRKKATKPLTKAK